MPKLPAIQKKFFEHKLADTPESKAALERMAKALRAERKAQGLKLRELAGMVGCSLTVLSHVENSDNYPSMAVYLRLCKVLKLGKPPLT